MLKRQIFHAENFQILYIDILHEEVEYNSPLLEWDLHVVISFQRIQYGKKEKECFTVNTSDKHYLSQVIKVNINW